MLTEKKFFSDSWQAIISHFSSTWSTKITKSKNKIKWELKTHKKKIIIMTKTTKLAY